MKKARAVFCQEMPGRYVAWRVLPMLVKERGTERLCHWPEDHLSILHPDGLTSSKLYVSARAYVFYSVSE